MTLATFFERTRNNAKIMPHLRCWALALVDFYKDSAPNGALEAKHARETKPA
jgi:hypothetical protein